MTDTGITRKVDELGRIVLPMELRRTLGIKVRDPLTIFVEDERIILAKPHKACTVCGSTENDTKEYKDRLICTSCIKEISKLK